MYKVKNLRTGKVDIYETIGDFLYDIHTEELIIEWINQIYPAIKIPLIGEVSTGELIYKLTNGYSEDSDYQIDWINLVDDWIMSEEDELLYELRNYDEPAYYGDYEIEEIEEE